MIVDLWHEFRQKAARAPRRIVLADGEDPRVIEAAAIAKKERLAEPFLIGSPAKMQSVWSARGNGLPIPAVDPESFLAQNKDEMLSEFLSAPKHKSLSQSEALERLRDPLVFGCLYLKTGRADGFIGGAARTTADTLRAVFSIIGLAPRANALFGFFLIERKDAQPPCEPLVLLADCAVIPDPSAKQLSHIAIGAAEAFQFFTERPPRVAFLSFSTKGSAEHPFVDKMREALSLARAKAPEIRMEGEWQADAALDPFSARIKGVGDSPMAGRANVLIAPDLNCGNVAYKLAQRLGGCRAVGPVLWGTARPANDLSRGCSVDDIVDLIALTGLQAQAMERN